MLSPVLVTAAQMRSIEDQLFAAGMPIPALMEKVGLRLCQEFVVRYPADRFPKVGIVVGSGHNGGDALVVARELWLAGRQIAIYLAFPEKLKPLTASHWQYLEHMSGLSSVNFEELQTCDVILDGLFGLGLERAPDQPVQAKISALHTWQRPIVSIDLPSGLHTDRGPILGTPITATDTFCLGLWKRGLFLEDSAPFVGNLHLVTFGIPETLLAQELGNKHPWWRIDPQTTLQQLPPPRPITTHKYKMGHVLIVAGSQQFGGAALLSALGARATGVGMITILVPASLAALVLATVPEALVIPCPEQAGAIAQLPDLNWSRYQSIACGMGLTLAAAPLIAQILQAPCPIVVDADGLNVLAQQGVSQLLQRPAPTILTPHWGEFCRLFPQADPNTDRWDLLQEAAIATQTTLLLKGAHTAISFATPTGQQTWINPESTPALARGGSGDVLSGMIGGLLAQGMAPPQAAIGATVWHAQTARWLVTQRTAAGVDPTTLAHQLLPFLGLTKK